MIKETEYTWKIVAFIFQVGWWSGNLRNLEIGLTDSKKKLIKNLIEKKFLPQIANSFEVSIFESVSLWNRK